MTYFNSWIDLERDCPIKIERIKRYAKEFESYCPAKITNSKFNSIKENLLNARRCLDLMIVALTHLLYDSSILKTSQDRILFEWIKDNLGRYMGKLDELEDHLLIKFDEPDDKESRVGVSRLSAYLKALRIAVDSLIYESLLKATKEYNAIDETKEIKVIKNKKETTIKIIKEPRTFLYILFQVLNVTLSVLGGLSREKGKLTKKGMVQTIPSTWSSLMSAGGQKIIGESFEEETGVKLKDMDFNDGFDND